MENIDICVANDIFQQAINQSPKSMLRLVNFSKDFHFGQILVPASSWISSGLSPVENIVRVVQIREINGKQNTPLVFTRGLDGVLRTFENECFWCLSGSMLHRAESLFVKYGIIEMDGLAGEYEYTYPGNPKPVRGFLIEATSDAI